MNDEMKGLHKAIEQQEWDHIREFINSGVDVDTPYSLSRFTGPTTILNTLIERHHNDLALMLLKDHGASTESVDDMTNCPPLFVAVSTGNTEMAHALLDLGANVNCSSTLSNYGMERTSVLGVAVEQDCFEIAQRLIEMGADINDPNKKPILHHANSVKMCELVLSNGAAVDTVNLSAYNDLMETALHQSARQGRDDLSRCLIDHGADTKRKTSYGKSAEDLSEFVRSYSEKRKLEQALGDVMQDAPVKKRRM